MVLNDKQGYGNAEADLSDDFQRMQMASKEETLCSGSGDAASIPRCDGC
jgi:hypothetical protein